MKNIGYSKVGRAWKLDPFKGVTGSGDADVANALHRLAELRPDDTFYLLGRNSGESPQEAGYPANVVNPWQEIGPILKDAKIRDNRDYVDFMDEHLRPWFLRMDEHVVWAGQHGTSNSVIPKVDARDEVTNPQDSMVRYGGFIIDGLNHWRDVDPYVREEVWLCPDVRNYIKCRDLKWPLQGSVIAQYEQTLKTKHERYGDPMDASALDAEWAGEGVWFANTRYTYDGLELTALDAPDDSITAGWAERLLPLGMIVNENRAYVTKDRLSAVQDYVLSSWPDAEIFGKWSADSLKKLGREDIRPCPAEYMQTTLQRWKCTLTTPASGSGWATAKPWEAFRNRTVCFFHPHYDTQNHVLDGAPDDLRRWLRVDSPEMLRDRVRFMGEAEGAWRWITAMQYEHYVKRYADTQGGVAEINRRLGS